LDRASPKQAMRPEQALFRRHPPVPAPSPVLATTAAAHRRLPRRHSRSCCPPIRGSAPG